MKSRGKAQKIFQLIFLFSILWVLLSITTNVATGQSIDNSNIKIVTPEDNLEEAIKKLEPGHILILKDGVYQQTLKLERVHGTKEHPITIRAENDGQAVIDGQLKRRAIYIGDASYIHLEGIFAKDGWSEWETNVVLIDQAHHIRLSRITAYKSATLDSHSFVFKIREGSHHILLEDTAGYGSARKIFNAHENTHHIIVRRFFARWDFFDPMIDSDPNIHIIGAEFYGGERIGHDNVFENVVSFIGPEANLPAHSIGAGGGDRHKILGSISLNSNRMPFYFSGCSHCLFQDNVAIHPSASPGFTAKWSRSPFFSPMEDNAVKRFTWISNQAEANEGVSLGPSVADRDSLTVTHSFFKGLSSSVPFAMGGDSQGAFNHTHNRFYGFELNGLYNNFHLKKRSVYHNKSPEQIMQEHREALLAENPFGSLLPFYGNGAYLMASQTDLANQGENGSTVGADVLYQYESEWYPADEEAPVITTLTDKPLWPWPMGNRICAETAQIGDGVNGTSVTYEAHTIEYDYDGNGQPETYNCSGGIWKSLDGIYEDVHHSTDPDEQPVPTTKPTSTPTEKPTSAPTPKPTDAAPTNINFDNWLDTDHNNSMAENDDLFNYHDVDGEQVFGTISTLTNIHSHYIGAEARSMTSYEYTGRMMITEANGGVGITFFSQYPQRDAYYRLRRYDNNSFHIAPHPHGTNRIGGDIDTDVVPVPNIWYEFKVEVQDTGNQTQIRAKVWPTSHLEPSDWQVNAFDNSANRLTTGTIGVWAMGLGNKYWVDLATNVLSTTDNNQQLTPTPVPTSLMPPVTTTEPIVINLAAGESISFNCDGRRLVLERNDKTQIVGTCSPSKN